MDNSRKRAFDTLNIRIIQFTVFFISVLTVFVFFGKTADAASLYFSPSSGKYQVGQTFSVTVAVESSDQAMNAADGVVTFPTDKLEVVSVSKGGSIYNFWVQEPSFNNSVGTVNFEGIIFTPGFQGGFGGLVTITFRARAVGNASVSFARGSVLANDGFGTNISEGFGSGTYSIGTAPPTTRPPAPPPVITDVPQAPVVTSYTHPDHESWYTFTEAVFDWEILEGIIGVSYMFDQTSTTEPDTDSEELVDTYEVKDIEDGVWYFHLRLESRAGWGETAHYRIQVDATTPDFFYVVPVADEYDSDREPSFILFSFDSLSGLSHYEVEIDETPSISFLEAGAERYTAPKLRAGVHTLRVKAVDRAGNFLEDSIEFTVGPPEKTDQLITQLLFVIFVLVGILYILLFILLLVFFLRNRKKKE